MNFGQVILIVGVICASLAPGKCRQVQQTSILPLDSISSETQSSNNSNVLPLAVPDPENILNFACIKIAGSMEIALQLPHSVLKKPSEVVWEVFQVPPNANVTGECESASGFLKLLQIKWNSNSTSGRLIESILQFHFLRTEDSYSLDLIVFKQPQNNIKTGFLNLSPLNSETNFGHSSLCTFHQLADHHSRTFLKLRNFRFEVFPALLPRNDINTFSPPVDLCPEGDPAIATNDIFPKEIGTSWSTYLINLVLLLVSCFIVFGLIVGFIKLHKYNSRHTRKDEFH